MAHLVTSNVGRVRGGFILPMRIVGDRCCAEQVVWGMIQTSAALRGLDLTNFFFNAIEDIMLDPGGMMMLDDPLVEFEIFDQKFKIYQQHLGIIESWLDPEAVIEERLDGWHRLPQSAWNLYFPTMMRLSLYHAVKREREERKEDIEGRLQKLRRSIEINKNDPHSKTINLKNLTDNLDVKFED